MINTDAIQSSHFFARLAGLFYCIFTLCGLIKNFALNTQLTPHHTPFREGVFLNEIQFRLGIGLEALMFVATLIASYAFYQVFSYRYKAAAQIALCFRLCEVILGGMVVILSMAMLRVTVHSSYITAFGDAQIPTIVRILNSVRMPAYEYSWIFMGIAGVITFQLFYRTRYIPRFWGVWGMFTYASLIFYPLVKILIPNTPKQIMWVMYPGALFELGVGIWLLVFGIRMPERLEV